MPGCTVIPAGSKVGSESSSGVGLFTGSTGGGILGHFKAQIDAKNFTYDIRRRGGCRWFDLDSGIQRPRNLPQMSLADGISALK